MPWCCRCRSRRSAGPIASACVSDAEATGTSVSVGAKPRWIRDGPACRPSSSNGWTWHPATPTIRTSAREAPEGARSDADPEEKDPEGEDGLAASAVEGNLSLLRRVSAVPPDQASAQGLPELWLLRRPPGRRGRVSKAGPSASQRDAAGEGAGGPVQVAPAARGGSDPQVLRV